MGRIQVSQTKGRRGSSPEEREREKGPLFFSFFKKIRSSFFLLSTYPPPLPPSVSLPSQSIPLYSSRFRFSFPGAPPPTFPAKEEEEFIFPPPALSPLKSLPSYMARAREAAVGVSPTLSKSSYITWFWNTLAKLLPVYVESGGEKGGKEQINPSPFRFGWAVRAV